MKVLIYKNSKGAEPLFDYLNNLKDKKTILRIKDRLNRIAEFGLHGDCKRLDEDIYELRFHFGSGYRIYFSFLQKDILVLLCAGDKSSQLKDIVKAKVFFKEFKNDQNKK